MSIVFDTDWKNEKGLWRAIPHLSTKNTSFLRTARLLQKMGVKNSAFMLGLYDPDLAHVDVHDLEDNTPENEILRTKVQIEARRNTWYFLRECIRIYEQGGEPVPFRLDRGSTAMTWCWLNGLDYCSMQPRQTGKEQTLDSLVRTTDGWVRMGDITLNHHAIMPDGSNAPVVGIYPQGEKDIYRVYFEDGRWTDCGEEHLWKVHNRYWSPEDTQWRVITLRDILERRERFPNSEAGFSVPLIEPETKANVNLPLDPYLIGALLGDGGLTTGTVRFSSEDEFIVEEVRKSLPENVIITQHGDIDYRIHDTSRADIQKTSPFLDTLRDLDMMGKYSYEKVVPHAYMNASPDQRYALLQGLMDTDGTVDKSSSSSFCTTSIKLAWQVQELVRGLGGICKIKEKRPFYTHKGARHEGRIAYIVRIRIKDPKKLFRLPRKLDRLSDNYKSADSLKLRITNIEYVGKHEAQCIEVGHPEHLYITDSYIVTHNTVCALSLIANVMYNVGYEYVIGGMAKDNDLRQENVKRVKSFGDSLPSWWLARDRYKDKTNAEELYYHNYRTHYQTFVAQKEKAAADKQGRGGSMPMFHYDEFDYIANIGTSYGTISNSGSTARENAKKNNKPHSNIITTTAGDPLMQACKEAAKIMEGAMPFKESLYDCKDTKELHELVASNSPQKMILGVFSHQQLGYSNDWLRDRIKRGRLTEDQVKRDFLNMRVSIADQPIIPKHTLAVISSSQREPSWTQILSNKFVIDWYVPKETVLSPEFKQRPLVVGCDSSEMIGRDATTLVGVDPRSLATVMTFRSSEGNINVIGVMIADLLMRFPKMVWVPENKSSGTSLIDIVTMILKREGHNPFTRMFNWVINNRSQKEFADINIRDTSLLDTNIKRYFGIKTDKSKRDELYSTTLLDAAGRAASRVYDRNLIQELNSLTVRNGRVDHAVGGHDDVTVGWLMAMWVILNGKHLDMYGIPPGSVLSHINPGNPSKSKLNQEQQIKVANKIEELTKTLKQQTDPILRRLIESDLELMKSLIVNAPLLTPETADDLSRDPRRFTDPVVSSQSKPTVTREDLEQSLRLVMNI